MTQLTALEYLVPSHQKRALLAMLLQEKEGLSLRQLAQRTGVPYSNAHREVGLLQRAGLLKADREGNAVVCRWNRENPQAKALERLFAGTEDETDEQTVFANLKRWQAPLAREARSQRDLSLEETLGRALSLARRHPEVACAWPVMLAKNLADVNLEALELVARRLGEKRTLGFFLSLTSKLLDQESLRRFASHLRDARTKKTDDFFLVSRGDRARRLAEENTPATAKAWHFRMNLPMESFESFFKKFVTHETVSQQRN